MMTIETFNKIPAGDVFAMGVIPNSPEGLYMTNDNLGRLLRWVAVKGHGDDWAIYAHWTDRSLDYICRYGEKVQNPKKIQYLLPCSPEVVAKYRR